MPTFQLLHFLYLPNEILCIIITYLDLKCMLRVEQVCQKLKNLITTSHLYKHIDVRNCLISDIDLQCVFRKAKKPKVISFSRHKCPVFSGRLFRTYTYLLGCLTALNLTGTAISDEDFTFLWTQTSLVGCLQELQVMDCTNLTNQIGNQVRCQHHGLEILQLSHNLAPSTVLYILTLTPKLKLLDMDGIVLDAEEFSKVLSLVPHLTTISCPLSLLTDSDLYQLVPQLHNPKVLMI